MTFRIRTEYELFNFMSSNFSLKMELLSMLSIIFWMYTSILLMNGNTEKTYVIDGFSRESWENAFRKCQQRDMKLVSIETAEENDHLKKILQPSKQHPDIQAASFWTSGILSRQKWIWASSNKPFGFTDWVLGTPKNINNNVCVRIWGRHNFRWDNYDCNAQLNFICESNEDNSEPDVGTNTEEPDSDMNTKQIQNVEIKTDNNHDENEFQNTKIVAIDDRSEGLEFPTNSYNDDMIENSAPMKFVSSPNPFFQDVPVLKFRRFNLIFILDSLVDWQTAKWTCNHNGMELAVIENEHELRQIAVFLRRKGLERLSFWIGNFRNKRWANNPQFQHMNNLRFMPYIDLGVKSHKRFMFTCPLLTQRWGISLVPQACNINQNFICQQFLN